MFGKKILLTVGGRTEIISQTKSKINLEKCVLLQLKLDQNKMCGGQRTKTGYFVIFAPGTYLVC